ncbi:hypothetical protein [Cellulomonas sp. Root137]|uniref:hypothetical protein n=1 Tax=Cellulomonas sp. Root137 TaxID=1736459 RepID=UPI000AEB0299|nr:hypothetical protein [Cellulomonas sp. Root137]
MTVHPQPARPVGTTDRAGAAVVYTLRVTGHLDPHWAPSLGGLTLTHDDDGATSLTGVVADQAELHGLLARIRDLGVTLVSVGIVDPVRGPGGGGSAATPD